MPERPQVHRPNVPRQPDPRPSAAARGYGSAWRKARLAHLRAHPLCEVCLSQGKIVPARQVDHAVAHRGDAALFWAHGNWVSMCDSCHSQKTVREDGGLGRGR
jgi:5-methylcytosine-specific restriction enzyme A